MTATAIMGICLLKDIENRECAFLCKNCCKTSFINFEVIINSETLKFIIRMKLWYRLLDELNKFELNQLHFLKLFVEFCYI